MHTTFNQKLFSLLLKELSKDTTLHPKLSLFLKNNPFIFNNECYVLKKVMERNKHMQETDFIDKTGYECFINSIHIDDYINSDLLIQSILFIKKILLRWNKLNNNLTLRLILSETDFGFNIKFHVVRANEEWINPTTIVTRKEALLIIDSN
jgi:hypothetical protein